MAKEINNIHDKFVRESFSDPKRASAFFEQFLPEKLVSVLDLPSLKVVKESYINEELEEFFSDLVFEVSLKSEKDKHTDVALLFEHKSSPDKNVQFQIGHYMFSHWMNCIKNKLPLKAIIPVIYYQGKKKWKVPDLSIVFNNYPDHINDYLPRLKHVFLPLNEIPEDRIEAIRESLMAAAIIAQKWRINPVKLQNDFARIYTLFPIDTLSWNFLEMIVVYALNVSDITEEQLAEAIKSSPPKIKDNIMTTYTRMTQRSKQEGIQEGIQKGIQEGIQKGKIDMITSMYEDGFEIEKIAKIAKLSMDEVKQILTEKGISLY